MLNTDRDPIDPTALAPLVAHLMGLEDADPDAQEASAKDLIEALHAQGCLTPTEARDAYFEPGCFEHGVAHLYIESADLWLQVDPDGSVSVF